MLRRCVYDGRDDPMAIGTPDRGICGGPDLWMVKQGYHHGNLRQALIDAALDADRGTWAAGLHPVRAAKAAGVTPAAVYRHFAGREDLIAEAARQGYEIFADLMDYAYNGGKPTALAAFEATGRAYLAFARKYPGHYMAMFESGVSVNRNPELARAAARARGVLEKAARQLSQHIPAEKRPPAGDVQRPYLGDEPWRGGTVRPRPEPGTAVPLPARGPARGRHRHLPARARPDSARQHRLSAA